MMYNQVLRDGFSKSGETQLATALATARANSVISSLIL